MPVRIINRPWTRQPHYAALPAAGGLFLPAQTTILTPQTVASKNGAVEAGQDGLVYAAKDATAVYVSGQRSWDVPDTQLGTLLLRFRLYAVDNPWGSIFWRLDTGGAWKMVLQRSASSDYFILQVNGNNTTFGASSISGLIDGKWHTMVISLSNNGPGKTKAVMYIDGIKYTASDIVSWLVAGAGDIVLGSKDGAAYGSDIDYSLVAYCNGVAVDDAGALSLTRNPWQVCAPQRIAVPYGVTAPSLPTLSLSTYKPGTLTSGGWVPRITAS